MFDLRFRIYACGPGQRQHECRDGRLEVRLHDLRSGRRHQLLQSERQHRYSRRNALEQYRHASCTGDLHQRDRLRMATCAVLQARSDPPQHHVCGQLLRSQRSQLRGQRGTGPQPSPDFATEQRGRPTATRCPQHPDESGRCLGRGAGLPHDGRHQPRRGQLRRRRAVHPPASPGSGDGFDGQRWLRGRPPELECADHRWTGDLLHHHALYRLDATTDDHRDWHSCADQRNGHRPDQRHDVHLYGHGIQPFGNGDPVRSQQSHHAERDLSARLHPAGECGGPIGHERSRSARRRI